MHYGFTGILVSPIMLMVRDQVVKVQSWQHSNVKYNMAYYSTLRHLLICN